MSRHDEPTPEVPGWDTPLVPEGGRLEWSTVSVPLEYPPEVEAAIDAAREARARMLDDVEATLGPRARRAFEDAELWAMDAALYGVRIVDTQGRRVDPATIHTQERDALTLGRPPFADRTLANLGRSPLAALDDAIREQDTEHERERRRLSRLDVCRAFDVRPEVLGLRAGREDARTRTAPHGDPLR